MRRNVSLRSFSVDEILNYMKSQQLQIDKIRRTKQRHQDNYTRKRKNINVYDSEISVHQDNLSRARHELVRRGVPLKAFEAPKKENDAAFFRQHDRILHIFDPDCR